MENKRIKICPKCGFECDSNFCPKCGAEIVDLKDNKNACSTVENGLKDENNSEKMINSSADNDRKANSEKFYYKTWFIILLLVLFWPVGLALMWTGQKFNKRTRIIISVAFGILCIIGFFMPSYDIADTSESDSKQQVEENNEMPDELKDLKGETLYVAMPVIENGAYDVAYHIDDIDSDDTKMIESLSGTELKEWKVKKLKNFDGNNKSLDIILKSDKKEDNNTPQDKENGEKEKKDADTLTSERAKTELENYGEYEYPYGFDLHSITGLIAEEKVDKNTWFIKAEVTVTNAYGTERETVCEGKIRGTNDNPEVIEFLVY